MIFTAGTLLAARIDVYPQSFDAGGWKLDVQFMDVIGSPYLLAHGCGIRVTDAKAVANVPESGRWHMWVRSRKWVDGAGVFKVSIDGRTLGQTFGVSQTKWDWEDGGEIELKKGLIQIVLEDKDGFDGRCAGVVLTNDGIKPDGALKLDSAVVSETIDADFVVVGGGVPGTCAAVSAARRGLKVALVQDRPVLGGNASSEIRVWSAGEAKYPLVREVRGWFLNRDANMALSDAHRMRIVEDEKTLSLHLCHRMFAAETDSGRIVAVKALDWRRNRIVRFRAPLFCDATGDGWLGYYAGADWSMGREAKSEYGEPSAPEKKDGHTLGASLMWTSAQANTDIPFSAPWAEPHAQGVSAIRGEWNWEYGIRRDMIAEGEAIRDRLFLAIYGAFSLAKKEASNSRLVLDNVPFLLGKRESRRLMGDWVYSERDVTEKRQFEDSIAAGSWSVDLHYDNCKKGVDFLTTCRQPHYGRYWIPYRSIYSRNIENLFMVGRCFSCTHVGLGGPRVINTLAQLGCAAGEAAALCKMREMLPRDIWRQGLVRELQRMLGGDFPGVPDPATKGWRIVDDETPGVTFTKEWKFWH
ncbi:MAG: FAD-dependent oxidoreductase, partial [Kiritimatiellae bacterium]|nr:FAD-dependent oxidoreductase [Kiritimatiellia bacterium]